MYPSISPIAAVSFAWAISTKFSSDEESKNQGTLAHNDYRTQMENFSKIIAASGDDEKKKHSLYYGVLVPAIDGALKNLATYLKHRDYHFKETDDIKKQQIAAIERTKKFGLTFENAIPKLASSTAIGGISGLSITRLFGELKLDQFQSDVFLLSFLGIGYLLTEFVVLPLVICRSKHAINDCNYTKRQYYDLYIGRCKRELGDLFTNLRAAYYEAYGEQYPVPIIDGKPWTVDIVLPDNEKYEMQYRCLRKSEKIFE